MLVRILEGLTEKLSSKFNLYKHQIEYFSVFIYNLYDAIYYEAISSKLQKRIFKTLFKILTRTPFTSEKIILNIILSFKKIFGNSLDESPQLVPKYRNLISEIADWFTSFLEEIVSKKLPTSSYFVVSEYLQFLWIIYGINRGEEEEEIEEFYVQFFDVHVERVCDSIFSFR